jgi:DNA-binding CsgD family transcriptional regulator
VREEWGIAVIGDELEKRTVGPASRADLRALAARLDSAYRDDRLAGFSVTDGQLTGLLRSDADELGVVMVAGLGVDGPRLRWAIVEGRLEAAGDGGSPRADGLVESARRTLELARRRRELLVIRTGEPGADRLLDGIAPLLGELLDDLTDRQKVVARMLLVDGLRQADVADALGVSRATVSVLVRRGRIRSIERLVASIRAVVGAARLALGEPA